MRTVPADYAQLMSSAILRPCWDVTSWLGSTYLGNVEIVSGVLSEQVSEQVRGTLDLTVPNTKAWRVSNPATAALGWHGQQLHVRTGWANSFGVPVVWFDLGRFRLRRPTPAGDVLQVKAESLDRLIVNARFTTATAFKSGTYKSRVQDLLKSILPVQFDPQLTDRSVKAQTYDRERIEALQDTLTAWPAQLEIRSSGVAYITRPWESRGNTVQVTYTDGPGGTLVDVTAEGGDEDVPNAVVASSEPDDGKTPLTETAYTQSGTLRWGGPYGFLPEFYSSPLLTTRAQLQAAAQTRLAAAQRAVQQVRVTMIDDGRLQLGDVVRAISTRRDTDVVGRVTAVEHGLTPQDRAEVDVTLAVISGRVDGGAA